MRYACEVCGERFFVHGHMKRHLYSHTGIKPHACRYEFFLYVKHLYKSPSLTHWLTNSLTHLLCDRQTHSITNITLNSECHVIVFCFFRWKCGAIFASYGGRMKHERAQHSENPYKLECDICGRPFRYNSCCESFRLDGLMDRIGRGDCIATGNIKK